MNTKFIVGLLVVVAGLGIGWYVMKGGYQTGGVTTQKQTMPVFESTPAPTEMVVTTDESAVGGLTGSEKGGTVMGKAAVTYTDSGYTPNTITVKKGTTVTWTNESTGGMWTASAVHPTHQLLPGFDHLKSVAKGGTYSYAFEKVGTWKYHNHVNASDTGTVVVTE